MNTEVLIRAIEDAGYQARSYSGRGMFGSNCVGVEIERSTSLFTLGVKLTMALAASKLSSDSWNDADLDDVKSLEELTVSQDSLGTKSIIYFPRVKWEEILDDNTEDY